MNNKQSTLPQFGELARIWLGAVLLLVPAAVGAVDANGDAYSVDEDSGLTVPAPGVLGNDDDEGAAPMTVIGVVDPANGSLSLSSTGGFTYTPDADFFGADSFDYTVRDDDGDEDTTTVSITVNPVNDPPTFTPGGDVTVAEDAGAQSTAWASAIDVGPANEGQSPSFNVSNDNSGLFSAQPAIDATGTLTFTPAADANGTATVTVSLTDGVDTTADVSFGIDVTPVNDAPSFTPGGDVTVTEDDPAQSLPWASAIDVGPANEGQSPSFNVGNDNAGLFSAQPAIDPAGTLTFTPAADANGSATVTVSLTDGVDTTADVSFVIDVDPVNDPPTFTPGGDVTVAEDAGAQSTAWASAIDVGPANEGQSPSFSVSNDDNSLFAVQPSVDPAGTLSFTPADDANGSALVTVTLTDGVDSTAASFNIDVTPVNDAPVVVGPVPSGSFAEDTSLGVVDMSGVFDDVDLSREGDNLVLEVSGVADPGYIAGAAMNGSNLELSFQPDQLGTGALVTVTARDDQNQTVSVDVSVDVTPVNDAPVLVGAALSDVTVAEDAADTTVNVSGRFDDVDIGTNGDSLTFSVSVAGDAVFDSASASGSNVILDYAADQHGSATVTVRATDTFGAFVEDSFDVTVSPVNDPPVVANPLSDLLRPEDSPPIVLDLSSVFEDPDVATAGDSLDLVVSGNSNGALFDAVDLTGTTLTLDLAFDQNGIAVIDITATDDAGLSVTDSFQLTVDGVNDVPAAADDSLTIAEDSVAVLIPVLDNDYLAETPTSITSAGVSGDSQSAPVITLDPNGDPYTNENGTTANGAVTIVAGGIQYVPKENFHGVDFFDYTITDVNGDTSTARVTVTVNPVNDPPTAPEQRSFSMLENGILDVEAEDGLLFGSFDVENSAMSILPLSLPAVGALAIDNSTGEFTYTPPVNFTGEVTFDYRVTDGTSQSTDYEARIVVLEAPEPPAPPPPGEVATPFNLTNVPLEQSTSVAPNVIVMMDDSGSMDWNMSVRGADDQGGFVVQGNYSTTYYYLWDLDNNIFGVTSGNGRILPTEEALAARSDTDDNEYGVWRARSHKHNRLYYNPEVHYTPWVGQDWNNDEFTDADPNAIRLNPRDPTNLFDMLAPHDYYADNVPDWNRWDRDDFWVTNVYIPYYYETSADTPLAWNDPHTKIEIRPGNEPFTGGPAREDCAADDGNALDCTYAQELQNFANWFQYYRNREYAAKNGLGKVIADLQDIRVGYETINNNRSEPVRDMNDLHTEGNKKALMDDLYRTNASGGTPLRRALDRAGDIFSGNHGDDPLLPAPEGFCQQNFTLLFSDGYWNGGDPAQDNEDGDNSSPFDGGVYADGEQETLADVAMYFYERDIRGDMDDLVPVSQRDRLGAPDGTFPDTGTPRMHQHMKTYTVAFGLVGTVDPATIPVDPTVPFAWPDPEAITEGKLDDMLHAAVNGRGQFLSAVNPQELQTALESAFLEFTSAASSTSAAAFNSTSLQEGTLLYRGFYDLRDFTGELSATRVNPDGTLAPAPEWRASEQLNPANKQPNNRVIVTFDPDARRGMPFRHTTLTADQQLVMNADEVDYIRGVRSEEQPAGALRRRAPAGGLLGDIVNSSPVFVGEPRGLGRDQAPYPESNLYSEFQEDEEGRQPMVYVGANDGILHGFDALTGEELFGYVPNKILDGSANYLNRLDEFTSPFYQHKYYVDLSPRISDAYVRASATSVGRSWSTILLGGLGAGGKGFFALNVTEPELDFSSEANAEDVVLWEFTDEDDISPNPAITDPFGAPVKDLGYSLSLPSLAMSNVPDGDGNEWVAIFGNGPNSTAGVAKLFVLFMDRGLDGWQAGDFVKLDTGRGVPVAPDQLAGYPNGLGTPALVDTDLNGTVDWVYAGDRLGNLYRFDLCDRDPATQECSASPGDWSVTRLFTATYDDGGVERLQPILSQPLVIKHPDQDGFLVIFGTGSYITREDADDEEIQSLYAIWDRGEDSPATALDGSKYSRLVEQELSNIVDDSASPTQTRRALTSNSVVYEPDDGSGPGTYGWYVDLDMPRATNTTSGAPNPDVSGRNPPEPQFPGEKAIRRLLLRNGAIITTTVLPSLDEFSCYGTRPGSILVLDAVNGGDVERPVIDFNNDGVIDDGDLLEDGGETYSAGLLFDQGDLDGALVDLSTLGGEGDSDWLFACGGNDCLPFRLEPPDEGRTGRLSWRELLDN